MNTELLENLTSTSEMLNEVVFRTQSRALLYAKGILDGLLGAAELVQSDEILAQAQELLDTEIRLALDVDMKMCMVETE